MNLCPQALSAATRRVGIVRMALSRRLCEHANSCLAAVSGCTVAVHVLFADSSTHSHDAPPRMQSSAYTYNAILGVPIALRIDLYCILPSLQLT